MSEEAKALEEVAKAAGKAIDAGTDFGTFVARYVSGPIEAAVGILQDRLVYARWERRQRLVQRAETFARENNLVGSVHPLPLNVAVPLITHASLEDDDFLQDEWAKLLVNAIDGRRDRKFLKSFVSILRDLTSYDAQILKSIVKAPASYSNNGYVATAKLPNEYIIETADEPAPAPPKDTLISLFNLQRLGLIEQDTWGAVHYAVAKPTALGTAFVEACTLSRVE